MSRRASDVSPPLAGWTVISLRPRGQHAAVRAAATRIGAGVLALSPLAIEPRHDAASRRALGEALAADVVLFTSPNAVRAAAALRRLRIARGRPVMAVGDGTRRALQRLGVDAMSPTRMDSEGLLAMPALCEVDGRSIGLVTAPGGRNRLAPALQSRGAEVCRADVYERTHATITAARWPMPSSSSRSTRLVASACCRRCAWVRWSCRRLSTRASNAARCCSASDCRCCSPACQYRQPKTPAAASKRATSSDNRSAPARERRAGATGGGGVGMFTRRC